MKKCYLFVILFLAAGALQAQTTRAAGQVVKQTAGGAVSKKALSSYGGNRKALMGVDYYLQRTVPQVAIPAAVAVPKQRSWLEQQTRNYKAAQLKRARRERDAQNLKFEQEKQQQEALRAALPQLTPERAFEADDFTQLLTQELPADPLPLLEEPGVLYRGMALPSDGEAVKNILQNGLQLKDLGTHATTKLLAVSGGTRGAVSAVRPVTNLTSFPQDALYWATQRTTDDKPLQVIVSVSGQIQSGKIVLYSDDIPADQISNVLAPLQIDGSSTWCNISLAKDGSFLIIPYQITP